ncbi:Secretory lipase [Aspergillus parasiticus SU-1]|uniref:Secretory lipase n=1 Tax=Aspergillus parasiticus (strain ATCC 56775 / NRRL 5862 / SRRC 143 / SU-1) TaxID=1403190 RepID=A0A0F0I898_ASPPU|nr:Secretory lipase [Aspergillus parasiticus SU-1]
MNRFFLFLSCLLAISNVIGSLTPPSQDPFYKQPSRLEAAPPGTILRSRESPYSYKQPLTEWVNKGYQILYRTSDSYGRPVAAAATVLIPPNPDLTKIVAFQPFMNSAGFDCSPSYYFVADGVEMGQYDSIVTLVHRIAITAALNQGWIVTLHDHEGLDASFMANRRGAHAVLDGIRATLLSSDFTDVDRDAAVVMMGYSGGSSPTTLAAELKSAYAPELNIIGVAVGGLLPSLQSVVNYLMPSDWTLLAAIWGLASEYPALSDLVQESLSLNLTRKKQFEEFHPMCSEQLRSTLGYEEIASYFHSMEFLNSPDVQEIFSNNSLGQDVPVMPMFIYESTHDEASPTVDADNLVSWYCKKGVRIDYRLQTQESHRSLGIYGFWQGLAWAKERFDGLAMPEGCQNSTDYFANTDFDSISFLGETAVGAIERQLGIDLPSLII